jgi:hypothetical protein
MEESLEKLTVAQLAKKFLAFCGTGRFLTVYRLSILGYDFCTLKKKAGGCSETLIRCYKTARDLSRNTAYPGSGSTDFFPVPTETCRIASV